MLASAVAAARLAPLAVAAPDASQVEFFEKRIRPMLVHECYDCHGPAKQKGGLRVDFRDGLLKGGDTGPALLPGNPAGSLLLRAITHEHSELKMPKDRPKLSAAVIQDFQEWIAKGAADPRDVPPSRAASEPSTGWESTFAARKDWWSFRPVKKLPVPAVRNSTWSAHPVDRFLLAKMEEKNLSPANDAERGVLLRRVTFALTGLPPTRDELLSFLEDNSPDAYEKVVDRLLNSPRFGERWARHWMDLIRFAETHGSEGDPDIPNAWRFRDYLIRAFNGDVSIDQLIREHLAGDLVPLPRINRTEGLNESLLGLAHFRMVEHGFQPVDTLDEQQKTIDNQIDVISKAFQGLTTSCARCHDHKFDPISQRDYYALHGVFASSRPTHVTVDLPQDLQRHRERLASLKKTIQAGLVKAWRDGGRALTQHLENLGSSTNQAVSPIAGDVEQQRVRDLEARIAGIDAAGRTAVFKRRGMSPESRSGLAPIGVWTFEGDARDRVGRLHAELRGGAMVQRGRLVLNGEGQFAQTPPLDRPLDARTLEAWVALSTLDQGGGGVVSVETLNGGVFDAVVFAERDRRKWMAGSDGFQRTQAVNGPEETASSGQLVHVAIVYDTNHHIAIYRNGVAYGSSYKPSGPNASLRRFEAGQAHLLFGLRHTGGGNPFLRGEIEEARLYDRALSTEDIASSFRSGPGFVSAEEIAAALTPYQAGQRAELAALLIQEREAFKKRFPDYGQRDATRKRLANAIAAATKDPRHPLGLWARLRERSAAECRDTWKRLRGQHATAESRGSNALNYRLGWDLAGADAANWFRKGANPPEWIQEPGEFAIEPEGERVLTGLLPSGIFSHLLSQKHNGILMSPRFTVETDSISVRALGGKGARVRLIVDNYPLGQGGIFPQATLNRDSMGWIRLDTAYRKGASAYLELATAEDVGSRDRSAPGPGGRSFFGVERIVFHNSRETPPEEALALRELLREEAPSSAAEMARRIGLALDEAIEAWAKGGLSEGRRAFLDSFVRAGLLATSLEELPDLVATVADYRRLEAEIPVARRAPGVVESQALDSPLLARGEPLKPREAVPRSNLQLISGKTYPTSTSGRLQLAEELASAENPLTSRVMVNRFWHHLFGRGLVATVDNFGRLGDEPTHPELLDYLATWFVEHRWSSKEFIRFLVTSRAFRMSSEVAEISRSVDPGNALLSHMPVRRLEAEAIRDSLLAVSGRLDLTMYGPGANALALPADQRRRSVYLTVRRNFLSPFLEVFDAPRPFTTLGKREATNVPAQSLGLLNDPFVIEVARSWATEVLSAESSREGRIQRMFEQALARQPGAGELARCRAYLDEIAREPDAGGEVDVWRNLAQSIFNFKEFIYLR